MVQGAVSWAGAAAGTLDSAMAAHPTSGHQALQLPQLVLTTDTAALYRPPVPAAGKPSKDEFMKLVGLEYWQGVEKKFHP